MDTATKIHIRARELVIRTMRGQSLTEYSLIFASIAVVAYGVYATMGNDIVPLANGIGSTLADACGRVLRHRYGHWVRTPRLTLPEAKGVKANAGYRFIVTDLGKATISGKCEDVGKVKGPILRGLGARAPHF
jgi:hypothetical protein